jgi:heptose I phosphotransferase
MGMNVETLDHGRLNVAARFGPLLRANGLDTFEKVMARSGGRIVRDFPGRQTFRLELQSPGGGFQAIYLKRYGAAYLTGVRWWRRRFGLAGGEDEAMREWDSIQQVRALGIPTAQAIALGQETDRGMVTRSFLMTAEISSAIEGDTFAERLAPVDRRRLMRRVAELARRFHGAGFIHKDFYLGHILVVPGAGEPELFLIDLQRVVKPCCFRERWIAKDLGAMAYSSLRAGATRTDLMRFYREYCQGARLGSAEKQLAHRVVRRVARLATRRPRHDGDFDPAI